MRKVVKIQPTLVRGVADEVFKLVGRDPLIDIAVELEACARKVGGCTSCCMQLTLS